MTQNNKSCNGDKGSCCLRGRFTISWSIVLGAFLVFFPSGVFMYWGNLSVYVDSYILSCTSGPVQKFPAPWIISTFLVCNNLGITSGRPLSGYLGRRKTAIVAIFLFNTGLFLSSFAIRHSVAATCASFGLLTGLGSGLLYSSVIVEVIERSGPNVGFLTQIVTTGYNLGAVVTNQYVTFYINPRNDDVDVRIDSVSYFSRDDVLETVPRVFLILGVSTSVFQVLGLALMQVHNLNCNSCKLNTPRRPKWKDGEDAEETVELLQQSESTNSGSEENFEGESDSDNFSDGDDCVCQQNDNRGGTFEIAIVQRKDLSCVDAERELSCKDRSNLHYDKANDDVCTFSEEDIFNTKTFGTSALSETFINFEESNDNTTTTTSTHTDVSRDNTDNGVCSRPEPHTNGTLNMHQPHQSKPYSKKPEQRPSGEANETTSSKSIWNQREVEVVVAPRRLFCVKASYVMLSVIMAKHVAFNLVSNYYKTLGENYIHDDRFLATLGSLLSLVSIMVKPGIGLAVDKCGIRTPTVLFLFTLCINSAVYPITPRVSKWAFLVASLSLEVSICAVNACCSMGTLLLMGKKYFTTNYGLLGSVTILMDIVNPVLIQLVLTRYGWNALFSGASIVILGALVIAVLFLPEQ